VNITEEVKAVRKLHPTWSFEESWNYVMATHPVDTSTAESNRILAKHQPEKEKEDREELARVEGIAKNLMQRNRSLTFGSALAIVRLCSPKPAAVKATVPPTKPRTMLIRGSEGTWID
jgi:hypothetical protein